MRRLTPASLLAVHVMCVTFALAATAAEKPSTRKKSPATTPATTPPKRTKKPKKSLAPAAPPAASALDALNFSFDPVLDLPFDLEDPLEALTLEPPVQANPGVVREPSAPASKAKSPLRISGLVFDGHGSHDPDLEQAVRITNTDPDKSVDLSDVALSDACSPPRNLLSSADSLANAPRAVAFPKGARLSALGEAWVAFDGRAFWNTHGRWPDYEMRDSSPDVPELEPRPGWPSWGAERGVVALLDASGEVVDALPYERAAGGDYVDKARIPSNQWSGPSVELAGATPFGWTGAVLARDRRPDSRLVPDTNTAADWDGGFSRTGLGQDAFHRLELPGQSRLRLAPVSGEMAISAGLAPDNAFELLERFVGSAEKELLLRSYVLDNDAVLKVLLDALKRGVRLEVAVEGSPPGGLPPTEATSLRTLAAAGAKVWLQQTLLDGKRRGRHRFDHSQYAIADGERVLVATESFGWAGFPKDPSFGNRGWVVAIASRPLAAQLKSLWIEDVDPKRSADVVAAATLLGTGPTSTGGRETPKGEYAGRAAPHTQSGRTTAALVACPDDCLAEGQGLLGLIASAKEKLDVTQSAVPLWWGPAGTRQAADAPNLPLQAVVAAARRGVKVRLMLDQSEAEFVSQEGRGTGDTARWLREVARRERLSIDVRLANAEALKVRKMHAQGVVADGARVYLGSPNWSETAMKGNRELGIVVEHGPTAAYFAASFERDWSGTRLYRARVSTAGVQLRTQALLDAPLVVPVDPGAIVDVVSDAGDFMEIRTVEGKQGFVPTSSLGEWIATPGETPALLARARQDRPVRVTGRVRRVYVGKDAIALNFGGDWRTDFSIAIPRGVQGRLAKLPGPWLTGRNVQAIGLLVSRDGPALVIEKPEQLQLPK